MVSTDHFRQELLAQMGRASKRGAVNILVNSVDLHKSLGSYAGLNQGMPQCCDAMQDEMKAGDLLLVERSSLAKPV